MAAPLLAAAFGAEDPARVAQFWAALLGRQVAEESGSILLAGDRGQLPLRFFSSDLPHSRPNLVHPHLTSTSRDDQEATVTNALRLGGRHLDVGQLPEEEHLVLADPEGNEFCVIEAGNGFLAGCGLLGELACDGGREVGLFWSQALGWPLVWDEGEETAIQSPEGGTKVAWGGPPDVDRSGPARQRLELTVDGDLRAEVDRLVGLGATSMDMAPRGSHTLRDPGGQAFLVHPWA